MIYRTRGGMCVRVTARTHDAFHGTLWLWAGKPLILGSVEIYWNAHGKCCAVLCPPGLEWAFQGSERKFFDLDLKREPEVESLS